MFFYIFHRHRVCPVDHMDLFCSLYSWWEGFESSALPTLPLVSIWVLFPPLHVGRPLGFALGASLEDLVCPCEGQCGGDAAPWIAGVLTAPDTEGRWQLGQQEI